MIPGQPLSAQPPGTGPVQAADRAAVHAKRFEAVWRRCVASPPARNGADVFAELQRMYTAPHRRFHNMTHIDDCIRRFDEVVALLTDPDAVEIALWFHDAVYDVGSLTNERRSAELFLELSPGAPFAFRHRVCSLIMATRHARAVHGNDRRFIVDIDLAGFGASWDEFMGSGVRLREESAALTDAQFYAGQAAFLQRLQRRARFFATDYFRKLHEVAARDNLRRLLAQLAQQGYASATR